MKVFQEEKAWFSVTVSRDGSLSPASSWKTF
jgi:hypothetical protein